MFRRRYRDGEPVWLATALNQPAVKAMVLGPGCVRSHRMVVLMQSGTVMGVSRNSGIVMEVQVSDLAPRWRP